jgi:transcriptional regulator with XRE-family HTH domain
MPRRSLISVRAQVLTALQKWTQKELAARIGVSERTIRRWKNENVQPALDFTRFALQDEFSLVRRAIRRRTKREAPRADPPEVHVPLLGERRELIEYDERGHDTGGHYDSDWVNYNVSRLDMNEVFDILRELRDRAATVQIIFRVKQYPEGNRQLAAGSHQATGIFNLRGWTDADLWGGFGAFNGLAHYVVFGTHHRILWIGVLER